ncbi:MAG: NAD(P)H-dependent oxidoreductase subunit E [Vulcanimicrobiaceae bacterium]
MIDFTDVVASVKPEAEKIIAQYEDSRSALLPIVHHFQSVQGYVSDEAMRQTAEWVGVPLAVVESTVSFYTLFFRRPVGRYMLQVCRGLSCQIGGAEEIMKYFRDRLGIGHLETTEDGLFSYEEVECLAACDRATCMQVNLEFVYDLTPQTIDDMLAAMRGGTYPVAPRVQTKKPERNWTVPKDITPKSPGAQGVPSPNDPGGIGDRTGVIMLDRFIREIPAGRTRERLASDGKAILEHPPRGH